LREVFDTDSFCLRLDGGEHNLGLLDSAAYNLGGPVRFGWSPWSVVSGVRAHGTN
jgi:hypothetical protein